MQLTLGLVAAAGGARTDVVVRGPAGTTLGEVAHQLLAAVLPDGAAASVAVAGVRLAPSAVLGVPPLLAGALLEVGAPSRPRQPAGPAELRVVGGPAAGTVHALAPGQVVLGRTGGIRLDDPDVSRSHCRLDVAPDGITVTDLGSTNGTFVDGAQVGPAGAALPYDALLQVGDSTLQLAAADEQPVPLTPTGDGHVAYNRPPRLQPPRRLAQVVVPAPPSEPDRGPIPLLAVLVPLVLALVVWRVMGNPTFLLFSLLSPVMVLGNVVTERRTGRRQNRRQKALWQAQREVAERTLAAAVRNDEQVRRTAAPDPALVLLTALGPRTRLWERRRDDDDLLDVRLGLADQEAAVEVTVEKAGDLTEGATTARTVPVVVSLREAGVLGLAGPRERVQALGRCVVTQAAVLHSPRDLQIVVLAEPAAATAWEWARWLPHCAPSDSQRCQATLGFGTGQAAVRIAELHALVETRQARGAPTGRAERPVLLVVDGARALRSVPGLADVLAHGPAVGIYAVALDEDPRLLPGECGATAVIAGPVATRLDVTVAGRSRIPDAAPDLVSPSYAEAVARALAPVRDVSRDRAGGEDLPASVRWTEAVGLPLAGTPEDVERVLARWAASGRTTSALLGLGPDGPFRVDLAADGPHALVAGTTGAGKSELLQALIASLATGNRPDELTFVLVDYKGGAAFGPCARLPHTVGLVTDLDGPLAERALISLTAELRRREALLAAAGVKDIEDHRRITAPDAVLPRLVIVVDEFATLAEELPEFVRGLVGIAQRGRSLGVHLVLATQRPEGVVSADIRANTNLRICLAVAGEAESRDVLGSPVATGISRTTPGRGYARTGHGSPIPFQTARVGGRRPAAVGEDTAPTVTLVPAAELGEPVHASYDGPATDESSDLAFVVEACRAAVARLGLPSPRSPWLQPLPQLVTLAAPAPAPPQPGTVPGLVFGLCDIPDEQARRPLTFDVDTGTHLMIVGAPRSGRTTTLRTLAGALARTATADDVHLYAVDGGGGLAVLTALPHTGAVVALDQPDRLARVLTFLAGEVGRRQALLAEAGYAGPGEQRAAAPAAERLPHLLLLLDRWEAFLANYQELDAGRLVDLVFRLLREGPAAGLHVLLTADRSALVGRVSSLIPERLLLRLADPGDYALAGLAPRLVPGDLPPGRGWSLAGAPQVSQVALLDDDPSGAAQALALQRLAASAPSATVRPPRRITPLPASLCLSSLPAVAAPQVILGVGGDELVPIALDLAATGLVVAGPPRSGRSTALLTVATQLRAAGRRVVAVAPRPSPLRALPDCHTDPDASYDLQALLGSGPVALLVDDAELLTDSALAPVLERAVRTARDTGVVVVAAGTTDELVAGFRGFVVDLRRARTGVLLSPQSAADGDLLGVRLSRATGGDVVPGRGLLAVRGQVEPLQVALPC
ncbi:MAG: cell division FtsK/SpoIIIE [Frankiales bacterium]|nr:cell division FtsK/SpoIIIE [Frankiales bacterium]